LKPGVDADVDVDVRVEVGLDVVILRQPKRNLGDAVVA
jgi:hypothetical protein